MTKWTLAGTTALAALAFGTAVQADVTPEEVWQDWQDMSASYGQTMTAASAERDGDTLVVTGLKILFDQDDVKVEGEIAEVNFTDQGDGTVEITMSDDYPMVITTPAADGEAGPTKVSVLISQPDMVMTAAGGADETSYDFNAPAIKVALTEIAPASGEKVDVKADFTLTEVDGNYTLAGTDAKALTSTFSAAGMAAVVTAKDPETNGDFNMTFSVADLEGSSDGNFIGMADMANLATAVKAGFRSDAAFTYGATAMDFAFADAEMNMKTVAKADSGSFKVSLDDTAIGYGGSGTGVTMTVSGSQIPFPEATLTYAEAVFDLLMPISKSDAPQDFRLLTKLIDLNVSDAIWGMLDPAGALPRDPATLVVDASGKAKLAFDLLDPAQAEAMGAGVPGELNELTLNAVQLKFGGAELTGAGALTFDNTDLVTFDGVPAPTGKVDLKLTGGNGLLDKLVAMGLVPEDQASGVRMMVGIVANSNPNADELTSTLEFKDKGFYANGQRLQ